MQQSRTPLASCCLLLMLGCTRAATVLHPGSPPRLLHACHCCLGLSQQQANHSPQQQHLAGGRHCTQQLAGCPDGGRAPLSEANCNVRSGCNLQQARVQPAGSSAVFAPTVSTQGDVCRKHAGGSSCGCQVAESSCPGSSITEECQKYLTVTSAMQQPHGSALRHWHDERTHQLQSRLQSACNACAARQALTMWCCLRSSPPAPSWPCPPAPGL
jgi:hypothetical protein